MKRDLFKILLLALLIPLLGFATNFKDRKHEKRRKIEKKYVVNTDATVAINNKYGDINITTWEKNQVEILVEIIVKGDDLDNVERKLDAIDIEFTSDKNLVSAKTLIEKARNSWSFWRGSKTINYEINYTVKIPISNNINIENNYGSIYLNELNGSSNIDCNYGKIILGDLNNNENNIDLNYCSSSSINYIKSGDLNVDYSKLSIDKSEIIDSNSDYSTLKIGNVSEIDFSCDYGSISIDEANKIKGNSDYAAVKLGIIHRAAELDADYGSIKIKQLKKGFEKVIIESEFTGVTIETEAKIDFDFSIELDYAGFKYDQNSINLKKSIKKNSKKSFEGICGKGNPNSKLIINSSYGSVRLQEL